MKRVLTAILLLAVSCAAPDHHRWTLSMPFAAGLGEDAEVTGVRFMDEAPLQPDWTIYWVGSMLKPEADGTDAGTGSDLSGELYEAGLGLRRYYGGNAPFRVFGFGEVGMGNEPWDTLDGFGWVFYAMIGVGARLDINPDWSVEGGWGYRYTYADVKGAFPGLDAEDAITGGIAWVGIGYDF